MSLPPPIPTADRPLEARTDAPPIGLQVSACRKDTMDENIAYDSSIMHSPIEPTLMTMTTVVSATIPMLSTGLGVPVGTIATHWLTSRSPMELPGYDRRVQTANNAVNPSSRVMVTMAMRKKNRELVDKVWEKLGGIRYDEGSGLCGFAVKGSHAEVSLENGRRVVQKGGMGGLYRCAKSMGRVRKGIYMEMEVWGMGGGGFAIGVVGRGVAWELNALVGSRKGSVGMHGGGRFVRNSGEWGKGLDVGLKDGDVVGMYIVRDAVEFWVNGSFVGVERLPGATGGKFVVSLYKPGGRVQMRCCEKDWEYGEMVTKGGSREIRQCCRGGEKEELKEMSYISEGGSGSEGGQAGEGSVGQDGKHTQGNEAKEESGCSCDSEITPRLNSREEDNYGSP